MMGDGVHIKMRKSKGLKTQPCGTPAHILRDFVSAPLNLTENSYEMLLRCPKTLLKFSCEAFLENHQLPTGSGKRAGRKYYDGFGKLFDRSEVFVFDEPVHKSTVDYPFHELAEGAVLYVGVFPKRDPVISSFDPRDRTFCNCINMRSKGLKSLVEGVWRRKGAEHLKFGGEFSSVCFPKVPRSFALDGAINSLVYRSYNREMIANSTF
ncbi:hypothetical protein TNCV_4454991 [Trichonephila clavipes]|nr:hypothetical protein TNCV_4454991 [Trichonephila clavipes]